MVKPVVLVILDGWGIASPGPGNAITLAKTPNFDRYWKAYPHTELVASGESVGLPRNEPGNSETGHLNLGAGRIVFQDLPRIDLSIADGSFFSNPAFLACISHVKKHQSALHLVGLASSGSVHSSLEHLFALLRLLTEKEVTQIYLHLFTDGRDSAPNSSLNVISEIEKKLAAVGTGKIATLCGRYFALDRDNHWERTKTAYEALTSGVGELTNSLQKSIQASYQSGKTDEFIKPLIVTDKAGKPIRLISDNDGIIFFNFRIDRPRQLTKAFILPDFESLEIKKASFDPYAEKYGLRQYEVRRSGTTFKRAKVLKNLFFVTMTEYEKHLPIVVAYPPETVQMPLARILSDQNLRQLHISETEKERFVGYYFDGQREESFPGENRMEIPSPKVKTYDLYPQMAAPEVTEKLIKRLKLENPEFVVVNFANPDMVGHTGVLEAGIKACEAVDRCLGQICSFILSQNGAVLITADHGNVEEMINPVTGQPDTEHSKNTVPFIFISNDSSKYPLILSRGILADVTPTILHLLDIEKPSTVSGNSLL